MLPPDLVLVRRAGGLPVQARPLLWALLAAGGQPGAGGPRVGRAPVLGVGTVRAVRVLFAYTLARLLK